MNILLIDDDKASLNALASFIRKLGHACKPCHLPMAAVEIYKEQPFDLVITDLKMPVMDGFQVLQEIMTNNPQGKVIIITGCTGPEAAYAALEKGAYAFFSKPFEVAKMVEILNRVEEETPTIR